MDVTREEAISKQQIRKHNNRFIVENGVFYSVRAKRLRRRNQLRIVSRDPEFHVGGR
jgi:hypothetical protein